MRKKCTYIMNEKEIIPPPELKEVKLPTDKISIINIDDLKANSLLIITINADSPTEKMAVAPTFAKLLAPYATELRSKRVTVILMTTNESIEVIPETDMNKCGWFKKEKSLIISPHEK